MTEHEKPTYIRFAVDINRNSVIALMDAIQKELSQGTKHFVILISSHGGVVDWGITGYNFLKGVPAEIVTHNFGIADSIAVVLYCAGKKRYSVPKARFGIHGVHFTFQEKKAFFEKQLDEKLEDMRRDTRKIATIISENTKKSKEEIMKAMYEGAVLNPAEAIELGLVHEIKSQLFESGAKMIVIR